MLHLKYSNSTSIPLGGMISKLLIVITLLISGSCGLDVLDGLKTGVVYQFELTTTIQLTNREHTKTVEEQESSAVIFAHFLHSDREAKKRVLVIWADNCVNSPCPRTTEGWKSSTPLKLFSVWTGSRISEILVPGPPGSQKWDVLRSMLFHLQYELKADHVSTDIMEVLCDVKYSDQEPKSRQLTFCHLPDHSSLWERSLLDLVISNFTQLNQYFFDGSSKLRQLSIREQYEFYSPIYPKANTVLLSHSKLKLTDQSQSSLPDKEDGVNFDAYLEILKKENDLHRVSESVEQLFADAGTPEDHTKSPYKAKGKCASLGGIESLKQLPPPDEIEYKIELSLKTLLNLTRDLRSTEPSQLLDCLNFVHETDKSLVQPLLGALAVAGGKQVQKTVFQFFDANENEVNFSDYEYYLIMLAHNLWPAKVATEVLERFEKSVELFSDEPNDHLALAAAGLARRSKDAKIQDRLLKGLDQLLSACDSDGCLEITLRAFRNLAHPKTGDHVDKFFCHKSILVVREALESMKAVDPDLWTNQTLQELGRAYNNRCPFGMSDSSSRMAAADLLLKVRLDDRWADGAGSILLAPLRNEMSSRWRTKREREFYTYSLARLTDLSHLNENSKKTFKKFVANVLDSDYNRLSPGGLSNAKTTIAADLGFVRALSRLTMEYSRGTPKRGSLDINVEMKNGDVMPLLSVELISRDLDMVAPGSSAFADIEPFPEDEDFRSITAGMRVSILDRFQPPINFFNGQSALMGLLWSLNGEPITAFQGHFLANNFRGYLPLASGHRVKGDLSSAVWWKMTGAVEVSLWYGKGHTTIATHMDVFVRGSLIVNEDGLPDSKAILRDETELQAGLTVNFETDIEISNAPFQICLQLNQEPIEIIYRTRHSRRDTIKKKIHSWKREKVVRIQGHCFVTDHKIARLCNDLLPRLGRD